MGNEERDAVPATTARDLLRTHILAAVLGGEAATLRRLIAENTTDTVRVERLSDVLRQRSVPFRETLVHVCANASTPRHVECATALLSAEPSLASGRTISGKTPLHYAGARGSLPMISALLSAAADAPELAHSFDASGKSAAEYASIGGHPDALAVLLKACVAQPGAQFSAHLRKRADEGKERRALHETEQLRIQSLRARLDPDNFSYS